MSLNIPFSIPLTISLSLPASSTQCYSAWSTLYNIKAAFKPNLAMITDFQVRGETALVCKKKKKWDTSPRTVGKALSFRVLIDYVECVPLQQLSFRSVWMWSWAGWRKRERKSLICKKNLPLSVWCRVLSQSVRILKAFSPAAVLSLSVFLFQSIVSPPFSSDRRRNPSQQLSACFSSCVPTLRAKWRREIQLPGFSSSTCGPGEALATHIFKLEIIDVTFKWCRGSTRLNGHSG